MRNVRTNNCDIWCNRGAYGVVSNDILLSEEFLLVMDVVRVLAGSDSVFMC